METKFTNSSPKGMFISDNIERQGSFKKRGPHTTGSPRADIPELNLKERALTQEFETVGTFDPQKRTSSNASKKSDTERKRHPSASS